MSNDSPTPSIPVNDKRTIRAWAMFDWANSSYALVITVAVFPQYFNGVLESELGAQGVPFSFLGMQVTDSALFSFSLSFAYLLIALALPVLSGIADYGGRKKRFMQLFTTIGSASCITLAFFSDINSLSIGVFGFIIAVIGFAGGQVFYNAYLPLIASEDQYDRVSAKGFAYGYVGSVILLIINLVMIQFPSTFGLSDGSMAARISFVMVGLWWFGFAQITFRVLPKEIKPDRQEDLFKKGFQELKRVWTALQSQVNLKRFLFSFFFYSAGVQTVLYLASTFATKELDFDATGLIILILLLQFLAILGAIIFARVSDWKGNKAAIFVMLVIWMSICVAAYLVQESLTFYAIAGAVGLVMGGIQSLSRSTYSKLLPENTSDTASYFSFYDVLEKVATVLGTFSFGYIDLFMGGMRNSILVLIIYFVIGMIILATVRIKRAGVA